ncbi:MAG: DUF4861 domain-containing protein [Rikenellaceae bacterium]|nr:DUF4861 domain-containing protein [Rikenellaceae bacterium]
MKKLLFFAVALGLASCSTKTENKELIVEVSNPGSLERIDEAVVLTRTQLAPENDKFLPAVLDTVSGTYVASQLDDLDGDGKWDELAFVTNLEPDGTSVLKIVWVDPADYPQFPVRTNIRYGRKLSKDSPIVELDSDVIYKDLQQTIKDLGFYPFQMDGVAWENDKGGFRHYFDGRNNRDYFGKRVTYMVLDSVGIKDDGFPGDTYHVWAHWGRDIMSVGSSFGIGGLGAWVDGERFGRLGRLASEFDDRIDSTKYTRITEGPVRSIFALDFYGWEIEDNKVDSIRQIVTIWAGRHNYENKVIAYSDLPEGVELITGIARIFNDMPLEEIKLDNCTVMATHDHQSYDKEFIMGMGLIIPNKYLTRIFDTPDRGIDFTKTWCAEIKLDSNREAEFYAYSAWEHQDEQFQDRDYFLEFMRKEAERWNTLVRVTVK